MIGFILSQPVQLALIAGGAAIIPGIVAAIAAARAQGASERAEKVSHETKAVTVDTAKAVDGRMTEMLELTRKLAALSATEEERKRGEAVASLVKEANVGAIKEALLQQPPVKSN